MESKKRKWLGAVVTYSAGSSYTVAGHRFIRGKPTKCKTRKARDAVYGKQGFHVVDRWEPSEPAPEPEGESAPEPAPKQAPKTKATGTKIKVAKKLLKGKGGNS